MEQIPSNTPVMESKPGPAGWFAVWMKVITKPNEQTFAEITESPEATSKTAYIWVFIAGTISGIFQALIQGVNGFTGNVTAPQIPGLEQYMPPAGVPGEPGAVAMSLVISLCISPLVGLLSMLFFAIGVAITQWIAKLFGGTGNFEKLSYAWAAISLPYTLITSVLSLLGLIPFVGYCTAVISLLLVFYILYLQIIAVKVVNRFGWGPAIGSVLIPAFVVIFACGCLVVGILSLLGPAIGDVFSGINQSLAP
jgi:hypothetical protein